MPLAPLDALKVDEWEQHSGHVINLPSVAGHKVFPGGAVYCATKYAVKALSEGLRMEAGDEIRSTNISPGAIATELSSRMTWTSTRLSCVLRRKRCKPAFRLNYVRAVARPRRTTSQTAYRGCGRPACFVALYRSVIHRFPTEDTCSWLCSARRMPANS